MRYNPAGKISIVQAPLAQISQHQSGHKEVLAIFAGAEESKVAWLSLLGDLKKRE